MQRYDINSCSEDCDPVTLMKDGDYVLYADHLADKEAAVKERDEWHIQQFRFREAQRDKTEETLREQIAALKERERVLIARLKTHGDIKKKPSGARRALSANPMKNQNGHNEALRGEEVGNE